MIEGMRNSYSQCEQFLSTIVQHTETGAIIKEAKLEALKSIAKSMFDMDLLEIKTAREKEQAKELSQDETIELFETEIKKLREPQDDPQIIVSEDELESHLNDGWQFVSVLPSQKILVRK